MPKELRGGGGQGNKKKITVRRREAFQRRSTTILFIATAKRRSEPLVRAVRPKPSPGVHRNRSPGGKAARYGPGAAHAGGGAAAGPAPRARANMANGHTRPAAGGRPTRRPLSAVASPGGRYRRSPSRPGAPPAPPGTAAHPGLYAPAWSGGRTARPSPLKQRPGTRQGRRHRPAHPCPRVRAHSPPPPPPPPPPPRPRPRSGCPAPGELRTYFPSSSKSWYSSVNLVQVAVEAIMGTGGRRYLRRPGEARRQRGCAVGEAKRCEAKRGEAPRRLLLPAAASRDGAASSPPGGSSPRRGSPLPSPRPHPLGK